MPNFGGWDAAVLALVGFLGLGGLMFLKRLIERINTALVDGIVEWFKNVNAMAAAVVEIRKEVVGLRGDFAQAKDEIKKDVDAKVAAVGTRVDNIELRVKNLESLHIPRTGEGGSMADRKIP